MSSLIAWATVKPQVLLNVGMVHVWAWDFAIAPDVFCYQLSLLSTEEKSKANRFRFIRDRIRYVSSHAIVRILLGHYLDSSPSSLDFRVGRFGKPYLSPNLAIRHLAFNLSHTDRIAMLAVAIDREVGLDVEEIRPIEVGLADRYFSEIERQELAQLTGEEWLKGFYNCWTRKEAILKAEGIGLNLRLNAFSVTLSPDDPAALRSFDFTSGLSQNWHLTALHPGSSFAAALATSSVPEEVSCYRLTS